MRRSLCKYQQRCEDRFWAKIRKEANITDNQKWSVPSGVTAMLIGTVLVYGSLFATGNWIYGNYGLAAILTFVVLVSAVALQRVWQKMKDVF